MYDSRANSGGFIGDVNRYSGADGAILTIKNCFALGNVDAYSNRYYSVGRFAASLSNVTIQLTNIYSCVDQKYYCNGKEINTSNYDSYSQILSLDEIIKFVNENFEPTIWNLLLDNLPTLKK